MDPAAQQTLIDRVTVLGAEIDELRRQIEGVASEHCLKELKKIGFKAAKLKSFVRILKQRGVR